MADKATVLIVEDNVINRKLVVDMVKYNNYAVLEAVDGHSAVAMATEHRPDLVLMDVQLEGEFSGLDAVKALKSDPDTASIPIVVVTAFAMKGDKERILAAGCEEYVAKPFTMEQLEDVLKRYIQQSSD